MSRPTGVEVVDAIIGIDNARQDAASVLTYVNFQEVFHDVEGQLPWKWHDRAEAQIYLDDGDAEQAWEYVMTAVERYQEEFIA